MLRMRGVLRLFRIRFEGGVLPRSLCRGFFVLGLVRVGRCGCGVRLAVMVWGGV